MIRRDLKEYRRPYESMLMSTVNYLRVVGCEHVAAKRAKQQEKPMNACLYNNKLINKPPKITNSTSTDVLFEGA